MKLSILIPTIQRHKTYLYRLLSELNWQIIPFKGLVEILIDDNEEDSIGVKRNRLLQRAGGEYLAFFDSDDTPSPNYISLLMKVVESGCDCGSLRGLYSVNGKQDGIFEHSLKYKSWRTTDNEVKYERFPNHLNCIKSSIAKQFEFTDKSHGEDFDWSTLLHLSGLLKKEYYIPDIIYNYNYISNKMKYSQSDEELFIEDYFADKPNGRFIDIGAYDVWRFSNVRKLYEIGWGGVLVEPAPPNYKSISEHYANDSRVIVLNIAIGETTGEIDFYDCNGDAISTTDEAHKAKWEAGGVKYTKIKVQQVSTVGFFNTYGHDVDFLSLDTESTNVIIFRSIPDFVWERLKMVVIEHDTFQEEIENKLKPFGFYTLYVNSENIILAK